MRQLNYLFHTVDQALEGIATIRAEICSQPYEDALLIIYASGVTDGEMRRLLDAFDEELPDAKRAGISEYLYAYGGSDPSEPGSVRVNLMLSEEAHFKVVQIPCEPGGERVAAAQLAQAIEESGQVKGAALYPANPSLDVTTFLDVASKGHVGVPFFGAMAALAVDSFTNQPLGGSFGIGADLLPSGFTVVLFSGSNLQVYMDYVLGWRPVGGEMDLVPGEPKDIGEGCIELIDGQPALQVYDKYLGVTWSDNFVVNVCEFPLMVRRDGVDICMVPILAGERGELYFSGSTCAGESIRFSYGTRESVVGAARAGSERMRAFGAQAVLMSLCGNRALFLGDEAHVEWDLYREANPQLAYCHGHYEIAWRRGCEESDASYVGGDSSCMTDVCACVGDDVGRGGVLTSALVAVGFREGDVECMPTESRRALAAAGSSADGGRPLDEGVVPLSYRLSRFFDVMTGELVHLQHNLEDEVERKTRENESLMLHVVVTLATAIDAKDTYTNGHSTRVARYSREIARHAGYSEERLREIFVMGVLHDVGKIGVPDSIINKPGRLTDEEFDVIKTHPATGARILAAIEEMPGLALGAHWHHERYDGRGYPDGLAGEDIPEEARIIAVADAYDAMTSNRSYREAMPQSQVREQVERGRGTQFDPRFADIMLAMIDEDVDYRMRELPPEE